MLQSLNNLVDVDLLPLVEDLGNGCALGFFRKTMLAAAYSALTNDAVIVLTGQVACYPLVPPAHGGSIHHCKWVEVPRGR